MSHSPNGTPQDIPRTPTSLKLSQCLPVCPTVPLGVPRTPHSWQLSQCPTCPTVPLGAPGTSLGLPPLGVVPVSCLYHSPMHWESLGHPKDSPLLAVVPVSCLSHSPIGSHWDIPRTPTFESCPSVLPVPQSHVLGVPGTSLGLPTLGSCPSVLSVPQSHALGVPGISEGLPTLGSCPSVLSVPQSHWEPLGHP